VHYVKNNLANAIKLPKSIFSFLLGSCRGVVTHDSSAWTHEIRWRGHGPLGRRGKSAIGNERP
jgi:hypothetical protein